MEQYIIYGSKFEQYFCQLGSVPEIKIVDSKEAAINYIAERMLGDIKEVLEPSLLKKLMESKNETAFLDYITGEEPDNEFSIITKEDGFFKYSDGSYLLDHPDHSSSEGCEYVLKIAKQEIGVDDSGNPTTELITETGIDFEEIVNAMKKLYSEGK